MFARFSFFSLCFISRLLCNLPSITTENAELNTTSDLSQNAIFVSLGSVCTPATFTRLCGIRTASFPFDWIVSMDGEMFLQILDDDFLHFFNTQYLVRDDKCLQNFYSVPTSGNVLLNTYYHLEFLHEQGSWRTDFFSTFQTFKNRFERRIARFKSLRNFTGKVFFMRSAYPTPDPHRFFRFEENNKISEEYSHRLYDALKKYFPALDFTLIIMNYHQNDKEYVSETQLTENLLMISIPLRNDPEMVEIYKTYFYNLMGDRSILPNDALALLNE